ncbi:MAG: hypothetical protein OEV58_13990, partial [Gammaproteobacteria bacterium]|nr:hypothetical protein [Gammaproteobacteria bacterium]
MPEGIVSVKIDKQTGCPARAGQLDVMFEVFLEDNVPDCERMQDVSDPFNNAAGLDPEAVEETDDDEAPESLF